MLNSISAKPKCRRVKHYVRFSFRSVFIAVIMLVAAGRVYAQEPTGPPSPSSNGPIEAEGSFGSPVDAEPLSLQLQMARTPLQQAIQSAMNQRQQAQDPTPTNVDYQYDLEMITQKNEAGIEIPSEVIITGTTVFEFDHPRQAGLSRWPDPVIKPIAHASATVQPGDYSEDIKAYLAERIPGIWSQYEFGTEPRTYIFEETFIISEPKAVAELVEAQTGNSESLEDLVMGFTYPGPRIDYTVSGKWKEFGFTVASAKAGFALDWDLGLRLPLSIEIDGPNTMTIGNDYDLSSITRAKDWSAAQYQQAGLEAVEGNEFVLRYLFFLGAEAEILKIKVVDAAIDGEYDGSQSFTTPLGANTSFPLLPQSLSPDQTGLTWDFLSILAVGIGLDIDPTLQHSQLWANWQALPDSDASGSGIVTYTTPDTPITFGPVTADDLSNTTDQARIRLDKFRYGFNQFLIDLDGFLEFELFGYGIKAGTFDIIKLDLSDLVDGRSMGTHAGTKAAVDKSIPVLNEGLTFSISGRVTGPDNVPIAGVIISDDAGNSTITGADGHYQFTRVPTGTYTLRANETGLNFEPASRTVSVPPNAENQDFVWKRSELSRLPLLFVHGFHGIPDGLDINCSNPNPDPYFKNVDDALKTAGYTVSYAYLDSSPCHTLPISHNAENLKTAIDEAKANTGQSQVILVAHSLGGLVSRAYIESDNYEEDVAILFTLGSPHLGTPVDLWLAALGPAGREGLGTLCRLQPVICEMTLSGMKVFNQAHPARRTGVNYHLISGDAPFRDRNTLGKIMDILFLFQPNDGIVSTPSGLGLSGTLASRLETDENHGPFGDNSYFERGDAISLSYEQCLAPVLLSNLASCGNTQIRSTSATQTPPAETQHTPFLYGTVSPSQTILETVIVENGQVLFAIQWQAGTLAMALIDPNGQRIDPAVATSQPNDITYSADDLGAFYLLTNAVAGEWQIELTAATTAQDAIDYLTYATFDSPLQLAAETDQTWYRPGTQITITATLNEPTQSTNATATLRWADGTVETIPLTVNTATQYQAGHVIPNKPGHAEIRIAVQGNKQDGLAFERETIVAIQVTSPLAVTTGNYTEQVVSAPSSSNRAKDLVVQVELEAQSSGQIKLSADLVDAQGTLIAHSVSQTEVTAGINLATLRFNGRDIFEAEQDGPYTVTNLLLIDQENASLVIDESDDVYTTTPYSRTLFAPMQLFLPMLLR